MARQRKNAQLVAEEVSHDEEEEISEDEQMRLIQESGVLNLMEKPAEPTEEASEGLSLAEEIFDCIIYLIPFSCLYVGMDIMIKQQYAQHPSFGEEVGVLINGMPILALFIFYTNRYKNVVLMQLGMFLASVGAGCRLIHLVNKEPWNLVIQQCPPLGVIWVYTIVQLHLTYACLGLLIVFAYVKYYSLKIIF